jgi:hypothetical protein
LSLAEIAAATGLAEGTVKSTLHFAVQKFKKDIGYAENTKEQAPNPKQKAKSKNKISIFLFLILLFGWDLALAFCFLGGSYGL